MADLTKLSDLHAATEKSRVDFLLTDLGLCSTFVDLVKTEREMGDREAANRILKKAETAYATMARMLPDVENADQKHEFNQKLTKLRARLDHEQGLS